MEQPSEKNKSKTFFKAHLDKMEVSENISYYYQKIKNPFDWKIDTRNKKKNQEWRAEKGLMRNSDTFTESFYFYFYENMDGSQFEGKKIHLKNKGWHPCETSICTSKDGADVQGRRSTGGQKLNHCENS